MKQPIKIGAVAILLIAAILLFYRSTDCSFKCESGEKAMNKTAMKSNKETIFTANMRVLWEEHSIWTRNVILCITDNLPGIEQAEKRLLQNQVDIGNAIKPYYGNEAGNKLTELLFPHITIAAEVFIARKSGNMVVYKDANNRWYANADDISDFFSRANPNWELISMKMMMKKHLDLTFDVVAQRFNKNYDAEVIAHDKSHMEILVMADMFSEGIIKQFPEKF